MGNAEIPLFDLNFDHREEEAVLETLRSRWISTGPRCARFEEKFAGALGAPYALSVANCTVALHLAMILAGIGPGDEVIVPSLTFVATANAVTYVGAKPVFGDICGPDEPNLDPGAVERAITPRTRAIVVMHYAGFPCRMREILAIARRHSLKVIEDACHAPLSIVGGKALGTFGDIGCFSFVSNKNMSTGEGGMLVTPHADWYARAKLLRSHGMTTMSYERAKGHATRYDVLEIGYNYRMDDIHAAIGLVQLAKLELDLKQRERVREGYLRRLRNLSELIVPFVAHLEPVSNYVMPVVLRAGGAERRDAIRTAMAARGVQTSVHYPAVHRFVAYRNEALLLPQTEFVTDHEITLPMYSSLTDEQLDRVVNALSEAIRSPT